MKKFYRSVLFLSGRRNFIFFILVLTGGQCLGQATDLIISEYGEGSTGNSKYIELYNGTGAAVNLTDFRVALYTNGSAAATATANLSGTLANGATYVIANNSTNVPGANTYVSGPMSFNGDDAVALIKNISSSWVVIDVVGQIGSDPGSGWAVAGTANATVDKRLTRKATVCSPNTNWTSSAGTNTTNSEWIVGSAYSSGAAISGHTQTCTIAPSIVITEFSYGGGSNGGIEFIELTNIGSVPVNMSGWSFDDANRLPGSFSLSGFGTVAAGESVIIAESDAATFRTQWGLCAGVKVLGSNTQNLGNGDEINIYNTSTGTVTTTPADRLTYSNDSRAQTNSVWPFSAVILGSNTYGTSTTGWIPSTTCDIEESWTATTGAVGSPGRSRFGTLIPCWPEISISGNSNPIPADATATSAANNTDFGNACVSGGTVDKVYTISNTGGIALTIGAIGFTGGANTDFSVQTSPPASLAPGTSANFTIRFNPSAAGIRTTTINIATNDNCENSYNFNITGTGIATPIPTFTTQPSGPQCTGSSITYSTQSGMTNYVWNVPGVAGTDYTITSGGIGTGSNTVTLTWNTAGSKTVTAGYTSSGCASGTPAGNTILVNARPVPAFTTSPSGTQCAGSSVTYSTQAGMTNYVWTLPGVAGSDYTISSGGTGSGSNTVTLIWNTAGSKTVTVGYTDNGCTSSTSAVNTITVNAITTPAVSISANPGGAICSGTSVQFTADAPAANLGGGTVSYQWKLNNGNVGTNSNIYSNAALITGDIIRCDITVTGGCVTSATASSADITMTVNPVPANPSGIITGTSPSCGSTTINYPAYTGIEYWQTGSGGTSTANPVASDGNLVVNTSATYYVRSRTAGGCWSPGQAGPFTVTISTAITGITQPADRNVTSPAGTTFTTAASTGATGFQWQIYNGTVWVNLTNTIVYSGVNTATLTIASTNIAMDGTNYRCIISAAAPCASVTTQDASLYINPGPCMSESFANIPASASSYANRSWTGDMGGAWSATNARTDQTINGKAICTNGNGSVTSPLTANGMGILTFNYVRAFTGTGSRTIKVFVNGVQLGGDIAVSTTSNVVQQFSANVNQSGNVQLVLQTSGNQIIIDDIEWTCYTTCTPAHTITSFSPSSGPAGTRVTITGTGFSNITAVKIGEVNISNYTVVNATTIIAQIPSGAASGKLIVFESACPAGTAGNFSVLTNNGNCNSAGGSTPADLLISEVFDSPSNSYGYIELFNGTNTSIDLSNYKIQRETNTPVNLSGTIDPGETIVFEVGSSGTRCGAGSYQNITGSGFNEDDDIKLLKGAANEIIDRLTTPSYVGYSYARTTTVNAPSASFISSQWTDTNSGCNNIGSTDFVITPIITVNTHPLDKECLEPVIFSVAATAIPNPVSSYRWMYNNPGVAGSGWLPVSGLAIPGVNFAGTNTASLTITGTTAALRNYQFYCELTKDLATDCIVNSNAAQYSYDSKIYYKANVASGNWTAPDSWLMSDNIAAGFVPTCTYPIADNSGAVIIPPGTKIIHASNITLDIDMITIEAGGELEVGGNAGLNIYNGNPGADLIVNGTLSDRTASGAGNGIRLDHTGTLNDGTWILGDNATIIKSGASSASQYRDRYHGGIAGINPLANWIYRYDNLSSTPIGFASANADSAMYYPNLTLENTVSGTVYTSAFNTTVPALSGFTMLSAGNPIVVKGNFDVGGDGPGHISFLNINTHSPVTVMGHTFIRSGDSLRNNGNAANNGSGFNLKGNLTVNGMLINNGAAAATGVLRFSGSNTQAVTGTGTIDLENVDIANSGAGGTGVDIQRDIDIPGILSFAGAAPKINLSAGFVTMKSTATRTAQISAVPAAAGISYGATGRFNIERYLPSYRAWRFVAAPVVKGAGESPSVREAWQEAGAATAGYGTYITGPSLAGTGFDALSAGYSLKWFDASINNYREIGNTNDSLVANDAGYMVYVRGDRTVSPTGTTTPTNLRIRGKIRTGDQSFTIPGGTGGAFQSIGNPYASAFSVAGLINNYTPVELAQSYVAWDPTLSGSYGVGGFQTLSETDGYQATASGSDLYLAGSQYPNIESGQAFYLFNPSTAPVNVVITEDMKQGGSRLASRENTPADRQFLRTKIYTGSGAIADGSLVAIDDEYDNGPDAWDALKFTNGGENFGVARYGKKLSVEARGRLQANDTIFYSMSNLREQAYQVQISPENLASTGMEAYFIDRFLNTQTPVSLAGTTTLNITVTSNAASKAANRFLLVFKAMAGPLPVTFVSVSAQRQSDRSIGINWKVANELNIVKYEVERSADGTQFNAILTRDAAGISNYSKTDLSPLASDNFYRIKAIGIGGEITYSAIVKVSPVKTAPLISIYPNPVSNGLMSVLFEQQEKGIYTLRLTDVKGSTLYKGAVSVAGDLYSETISLGASIAAGTYQLTIESPARKVQNLQVLVR